jgi:hypothetical protein
MPRPLSAPMVTAALLASAAVLGALHLAAPFLASHFEVLEEPRPQEATVTASSAIDASTTVTIPPLGLPDDVIVGVPRREQITRTTLIDINYRTPIDVNDTVDIGASLRQEQRIFRMVGPPGAEHPDYYSGGPISDIDPRWPQPIERLAWPITLHLDGLGFEWIEYDIPIKEGTPLPVTEHWVPLAKAAGKQVMRFRLRDINHAAESHGFASVSDDVKVKINGVVHDAHGSDDVALPISVWTHGIPANWLYWLTFFGTAISGLAALMVGVFGSGWGAALLNSMRRRPSHP